MREYLGSKRAALSLLLILAFAAWRLPISSHAQGGVTEAVWAGYYNGFLSNAPTRIQIVPADGHTLTRFLVMAQQHPVNCTTYGAVAIEDMTTATVLTSLTLVNGQTFYDSGSLSISMTGGHAIGFVGTQNPSGCYIAPGEIMFTAVYEGQGGAVTESAWSGFYSGTLYAGVTGPEVVLANNHTLTRFLLKTEVGENGCPTSAVVALKDMTTNTVLTSLTLSNSTNVYDSGALSITMTGGHTFAFVGTVSSGFCTGQYPGAGAFTAVYQ